MEQLDTEKMKKLQAILDKAHYSIQAISFVEGVIPTVHLACSEINTKEVFRTRAQVELLFGYMDKYILTGFMPMRTVEEVEAMGGYFVYRG